MYVMKKWNNLLADREDDADKTDTEESSIRLTARRLIPFPARLGCPTRPPPANGVDESVGSERLNVFF